MKKNIDTELFWTTPLKKPEEEKINGLFNEFKTSPRAIRVKVRFPNGWTVRSDDVPLILALQANGVEDVEVVESDGKTPAPPVRLTPKARAKLADKAADPPPPPVPDMKKVRKALKKYETDPTELEALGDHIGRSGRAAPTFGG